MSKKANPTVVGGFVVGAIVLAVIALFLIGGGWLLAGGETYVLYFSKSSLQGLNVGAPVAFRGVKIGSVTDIRVAIDVADLSVRIPVLIEVDPGSFTRVRGGVEVSETPRDPRIMVKILIEKGLKAQLKVRSMVTGMLMVALDFHPDKPAELVGAVKEHIEIPTIQSGMEELSRTIENLPIQEVFQGAQETLASIKKLVDSPDITEAIRSFHQTSENLQQLVGDLDKQIETLVAGAQDTLSEAQGLLRNINERVEPLAAGIDGAIGDARKLVTNVDAEISPVVAALKEAAEASRATMEKATEVLSAAERLVAEDSTLVYRLNDALAKLSAAARSIDVLADYIERHPEALLRGKEGSGVD